MAKQLLIAVDKELLSDLACYTAYASELKTKKEMTEALQILSGIIQGVNCHYDISEDIADLKKLVERR